VSELSPGTPPADRTPVDRLESWKEIAAYLNRDVTTAQRWEKREGMPVHRHLHDRLGSVYAFTSELDAWQRSRRPRLEAEEQGPETVTPPPVPAVDQPDAGTHVRRWWVLGVMAFLAVVGLSYLLLPFRPKEAAKPKITSLAVLPLENLSGDPSQDYLADGMTEAVIGRLALIRGLRVISRTSVMGFKDTKETVPQIAAALHVDAIVEGSVIRQGDRIRVHAQLIRAAADEHLWAESYDRELGDALALQSDVAQAIASRVQVTVTGDENARLVAARHVAPEVYESYLKGSFALEKSNSRPAVEESIGYFQDAIRRDPSFAPAYVGLANAHGELATVFIGNPPEAERAEVASAVRKAIELDPQLADAHVLLAESEEVEWHWAQAEAEYKKALDLNTNDAAACSGFGEWLLTQGRTQEALEWAKRARELDPLAVSGSQIGWIQFQARQYDDAIREFRSVLAVRPDDASALWFLGFALTADGKPEEAIPPLERALSVSDRSPGVIGVLIRAYAHAGRRSDALRLLEELKQRKKAGYLPAGAFLNAYLGLGENEEAFVWFEQAYKEHSNILQFLKCHPYFDSVRDDPRFKDLLRRVGLA
jgi:TolB-like protein/Flp pilus assembly protein TadD